MTEIELRMCYNQSFDFCMSRVIDVFIILFYVNFIFQPLRTYPQLIPPPPSSLGRTGAYVKDEGLIRLV